MQGCYRSGFSKGMSKLLRGDFKICGDELILYILKLQIISKKKGLRRINQ